MPEATKQTCPDELTAKEWAYMQTCFRLMEIPRGRSKLLWRQDDGYLVQLSMPLAICRESIKYKHFGCLMWEGMWWPTMASYQYELHAMTQHPARVGWISSSKLKDLLAFSPGTRLYVVAHMATTLDCVYRMLARNATMAVSKRVACLLAEIYEQTGLTQIICSHDMLARVCNVQRETISQSVAQLREQGLIDTSYRRVMLLQPAALQAINRLG